MCCPSPIFNQVKEGGKNWRKKWGGGRFTFCCNEKHVRPSQQLSPKNRKSFSLCAFRLIVLRIDPKGYDVMVFIKHFEDGRFKMSILRSLVLGF